MEESFFNKRPVRAIKRRRYSDDMYEETANYDAVFKSREIISPADSPNKQIPWPSFDKVSDSQSAIAPLPVIPAHVNVPNTKRSKGSSKRLKSRAQFMNRFVNEVSIVCSYDSEMCLAFGEPKMIYC